MDWVKTKNLHIFLICALLSTQGHAEIANIKLAYIGDTNSSAYLGTLQGLEEANLQGRFMGANYSLHLIDREKSIQSLHEFLAVIVAIAVPELLALINKHQDIPVFNIFLDDDALRMECHRNLFHVIPSRAMKEDALAQWHIKEPDSSAVALAWHANFKKFAARDLNKRFIKSHGIPMDDHAWSGWASVKMISDAVVRNNTVTSEQLITFIRNDLVFDGQKGIDMNFRDNGQLRQPILIVEDGKTVAEAPIRGVAVPSGMDSLGLANCPGK